ncbi:uncharacterized protein SCHCODRAFT_02568366 [Schizophyllum commune H4-8]|nr:uncharacterized protein SCHCODRAFT_02568366 [Schizophyllum commune H4-8]KAI5896140.1 hypothetical protein SCHCODRAFT_02568366 [Schizophyllum commune H4-8]
MNPQIMTCYTQDVHVASEERAASVTYKVCIEGTQGCAMRQNHIHEPLSSTIEDLQNDIDRLRDRVAHITVELHHLNPAFKDIYPVNIVAYKLRQLVGWDELVLRLSEEPLERDMEEASGQKNFLVSTAPLMRRTITFFGHRENVPAPWFEVGRLARCGVAAVNLHCTLGCLDFAKILQSASTNDNYSAATYPLKLFIKALDEDIELDFLNLPPDLQADAENRLRELHVTSISKAFSFFGFLWKQNCRPGLRVLSIDVRLHQSNQLLLSLKHLQALERIIVVCRKGQIKWLKQACKQRDWRLEGRMFCPEEDEDLEKEDKSWRFTVWPQNA